MSKDIIPIEHVVQSIRWIHGQKVLLDSDLAALYGVQTKNLNKTVKRNAERFPVDFMFQLTPGELRSLRFQFGTSKAQGGCATGARSDFMCARGWRYRVRNRA